MENTVETLGALERRLHVAVPIADIEGEVKKRLTRLARTVKVAGFRPGKAPLRMLDQQYGPQVRSDVITERVQTTLNDAIRAQNLRVAGTPRIEAQRGEQPATENLEFSAVFEVYPDVQIGNVGDIAITRPIVDVTAADVDRTLDVLRRQRTTYSPVDREARAGETKTFALTFPADYHGREVAGKEATFVLTVHEVAAPEVPALDGEFAKAFGIASGDMDDLRKEVEANLKLELKRKVEAAIKAQALSGLRQRSTFAVPKSLVESEASLLRERTIANMRAQQNVKPQDLELSLDVFRPQAEERVALGLIIAELVRSEKLQAKPEQVKALVSETAQTYEQPEAVVRWHYEKSERLRDFEAMVLEQNVVDWILARARVTEEPATFEQVMGPRAVA
jgi:trigger factor